MYMDQPYMEYGGMEALDSAAMGVAGFALVFLLLFYFLIFAFAIVSYVLTALGMYTIARRRGIHHSWLAWVPVGDAWLLGSISDQYQYVAKGRVRNRRKVLLGLSLGMFTVLVLVFVGLFLMLLSEVSGDASELMFGGSLALILLGYFAILILAVILVVFQYIALYDLFASCDPDNSVLYLVLSILLGVVLPFFVFACRNKDKGMPPKKEVPLVEAVVTAPAETVEAVETEETAAPVETVGTIEE